MCDATRSFASTTYSEGPVQIALNSGGSIRAGFPRGLITLGQEQQAFPFGTDNLLYTYKLQGRYLYEVLENGVSLATATELDVNNGAGKFLHVAGLRFSYNPAGEVGMRVVDAWVEEKPGEWFILDPATLYTVTSFDWFVIYGGDDYTMIQQNAVRPFNNGNNMNAVLLAALAKNVSAVESGQITTTTATRRACIADDG
jgi:2',3'-cyclic-nucleotide 2'-phosphodiesterase (5'-nucleotidase family)